MRHRKKFDDIVIKHLNTIEVITAKNGKIENVYEPFEVEIGDGSFNSTWEVYESMLIIGNRGVKEIKIYDLEEGYE